MTQQGKNAIDTLLAESLIELSAKKSIEKITIKEITDKAGVIRPTFYNHFQDKYELIECIIKRDLLEPSIPLINAGMIKEAIVLILTQIQSNDVFYKKLLKMDGSVVSFSDIATKCVYEMFLDILQKQSTGKESKHKWLTPEIIAKYYAKSLIFITEGWISDGMDAIEPREMAEAYMYLIRHSMDDVLEEL